MTCRLEKSLAALLNEAGIEHTSPERNKTDPTNLDFYLPALAIYIEVKQFHSSRAADQLAKVPEKATAILLQGPRAVEDFAKLCNALGGKHQ